MRADGAHAAHLEPAGQELERCHVELEPVGLEANWVRQPEGVSDLDAAQRDPGPRKEAHPQPATHREPAAGRLFDDPAQLGLHDLAGDDPWYGDQHHENRGGQCHEGHDDGSQAGALASGTAARTSGAGPDKFL